MNSFEFSSYPFFFGAQLAQQAQDDDPSPFNLSAPYSLPYAGNNKIVLAAVSLESADSLCKEPYPEVNVGGIRHNDSLAFLAGKAVLVPFGACSTSSKARRAQAAGAIALVSVSKSTAGFDCFWDHDIDASDIGIYVFSSTGPANAEELLPILGWSSALKSQPILNFRYQTSQALSQITWQENPWQSIVDSGWWIFLQVTNVLISSINVFMSITRIVGHTRKAKGCKLTIPIFCLSVELCSNVVRGFVAASSPAGSRLLFSRTANFILFTITLPVSMITTIILVFFFHELTTKSSLTASTFLAKRSSKVFGMVIGLTIFIIDVTLAVIRADYQGATFFLVHNLVTSMIAIVLASFFLYKTWSVRKFLMKNTTSASSQSDSVNRMTTNIMASALFMLLEVFFRFLGVVFVTPLAFFVLMLGGTWSANFKSFFQILAFGSVAKKHRNGSMDTVTASVNRSSNTSQSRPWKKLSLEVPKSSNHDHTNSSSLGKDGKESNFLQLPPNACHSRSPSSKLQYVPDSPSSDVESDGQRSETPRSLGPEETTS